VVHFAASFARAVPAVLVGAVVTAVVLAGSWDLADNAGLSPRISLLVAAIATMGIFVLSLSQIARRSRGPQLESSPAELGLLFGATLGVALGAAVVVFGLR
jgi:amino acid permease